MAAAQTTAPTAHRYDAFLVYSHSSDAELAAALRRGLERFARPITRRRVMRVFHDQASLSASPALWGAIEDALQGSAFLIFLASPAAASSAFINRELDWWLGHRTTDRLLIVLTDGDLVWDDATSRFDGARSTALPASLIDAWSEQPRWADARRFRGVHDLVLDDPRFAELVADISAPVRGISKDDLIGEAVRLGRGRRRFGFGSGLGRPVSSVRGDAYAESDPASPDDGTTDYVRWVHDAPARVDLLHREPLAYALVARVVQVCDDDPETSFLIHLDGAWGTGKSTILRFMRRELTAEGWLVVDFNAWRQSRVGPPWWALLVALRRAVGDSLGMAARTRLRAAEAAARMRRTGAPYALAVLIVVATAAGLLLTLWPTGVRNTADSWRSIATLLTVASTLWAGGWVIARFFLWDSAAGARLYEQSQSNPMDTLGEHFAWLVERSGRPVIFFLDDLDRCPSEYVVTLLESVQTLIRDGAATVHGRRARSPRRPRGAGPYFVVAADGKWIRTSFEVEYASFAPSIDEPGRPLGYLFLDKLFQLTVPVPSVGKHERDPYLAGLLRDPGSAGSPSEDELDSVRRRLRTSRTDGDVIATLRSVEDPQVRRQVAEDAVEQLSRPALQSAIEHELKRFAPLLEPNPRSMKRFVNAYGIARVVLTLEDRLVPTDALALWTLLRIRWPLLADHLRENPGDVARIGGDSAALDDVPDRVRKLFSNPDVVQLLEFEEGGRLTENIVRSASGRL